MFTEAELAKLHEAERIRQESVEQVVRAAAERILQGKVQSSQPLVVNPSPAKKIVERPPTQQEVSEYRRLSLQELATMKRGDSISVFRLNSKTGANRKPNGKPLFKSDFASYFQGEIKKGFLAVAGVGVGRSVIVLNPDALNEILGTLNGRQPSIL